MGLEISLLNMGLRSADCGKEECSGQRLGQRLGGMRLKAGRAEMRLLQSFRTGNWGSNSTEVHLHFID